VVTALPEPGDVIGQGSVLLEVDAQPVVTFIGDVPAYRTLRHRAEPDYRTVT
jgi:hypothetical protein